MRQCSQALPRMSAFDKSEEASTAFFRAFGSLHRGYDGGRQQCAGVKADTVVETLGERCSERIPIISCRLRSPRNDFVEHQIGMFGRDRETVLRGIFQSDQTVDLLA